jgi:hypothetical protein
MKMTQYLNWKDDPSKGEVLTPTELVKEMLDTIPEEVWKNPVSVFLDPCMGKGTFLIEIVNRLTYIYGYTQDEAKSRVYGYDIRVKYVNHLIRRGFKNVRHKNFLNEEIEMQFDVILGNPPYLKGVWRKFFKKSSSLSKQYIIMVSPDATKTFSTRSEQFNSFLAGNGLQSITPCTHFFPKVNSGEIVYYFLDKNKEYNDESIKFDEDVTNKINYFKNNFERNLNAILSNKRSKKDTSAPRFDEETEGTVLNLESVTIDGPLYKYINSGHTHQIDGRQYWLTNRYFGKSDCDNTPMIEIDELVNISSNVLAIERIPDMSLDEFKKIYLSSFFREFLTKLRGGGFDTSPRHLKQLPIIYSLNELSKNIF